MFNNKIKHQINWQGEHQISLLCPPRYLDLVTVQRKENCISHKLWRDLTHLQLFQARFCPIAQFPLFLDVIVSNTMESCGTSEPTTVFNCRISHPHFSGGTSESSSKCPVPQGYTSCPDPLPMRTDGSTLFRPMTGTCLYVKCTLFVDPKKCLRCEVYNDTNESRKQKIRSSK